MSSWYIQRPHNIWLNNDNDQMLDTSRSCFGNSIHPTFLLENNRLFSIAGVKKERVSGGYMPEAILFNSPKWKALFKKYTQKNTPIDRATLKVKINENIQKRTVPHRKCIETSNCHTINKLINLPTRQKSRVRRFFIRWGVQKRQSKRNKAVYCSVWFYYL